MARRAVALFCSWFLLLLTTSALAQRRPKPAPAPAAAPAAPAPAPAPPAGGTPVLPFESDDAEEQADAFTDALRAKVKTTPGWVFTETSVSLAVLTAALKCRLDAPCLQKVGDQLRADRFFWGRVTRAGKTQVSVEAHYWQRGKHDSVVKELYSDDLRDANSEALKKVANRVFERLTGTLTTGMVVIHAGRATGTVLVDGEAAGSLVDGSAQIELKSGAHTIEVRPEGYLPVRQSVNVVVGAESPVTIKLVKPTVDAPKPVEAAAPIRRITAFTAIGVGLALGAVGVVEGVQWMGHSSDLDDLKKQYPKGVRPDASGACGPVAGVSTAQAAAMERACETKDKADKAALLGWIAGGAGAALVGAGVLLLATEPKGSPQAGRGWNVSPEVGRDRGGLRLHVAF